MIVERERLSTYNVIKAYIAQVDILLNLKMVGVLMMTLLPLNLLPVGCTAKVKHINASGILRRRLMDLGVIPETEIKVVRRSLSGDPTLYEVRGAMIALRHEDASKILVKTTNS